jgi:DNA repair protein RadC
LDKKRVLPGVFQDVTSFSPSRPARGGAVLASALRAALTAALRCDDGPPAGNPACKETLMKSIVRSARALNVRPRKCSLRSIKLRFSSGFVRELSGEAVSDDAVIDVALRILSERVLQSTPLANPRATREFLAARFANLEHEVFTCLYLDNRNRVIACEDLFRGTLDGSSVHPREVVKQALTHNAAAVILAHNHPSGIAEPSQPDELITRRLKQALALVDIRVLDHLIVGGATTTSLAEQGLL